MIWEMTAIPQDGVRAMWPQVASLLAPAVAYSSGRMDMRSVLEWLLDRRYQLWVVYSQGHGITAALVTREARYPRRSVLTVDLCGGKDLAGWASEATRVFREYARDCGLDGVEMFGRRGWVRALKPYGWNGEAVLLEINAAAEGQS